MYVEDSACGPLFQQRLLSTISSCGPSAASTIGMPAGYGIQRAFHAEQPHPSGLVKLSVLPDREHFLAGHDVTGIVQLECVSEKVFLGDIWLECYGSEGDQITCFTAKVQS